MHSVFALFGFTLGLPGCLPLQAQKPKLDGVFPYPYAPAETREYKGTTIQNFYIPMRDSVQLALTLHLPRKLEPGKRIPLIIHQTRYWRNFQLKRPFNKLINAYYLGRDGRLKLRLVERGYAFLDVDTRGTGASYGRVPFPWSKDEIVDGANVVDWALQQPWCDGNVGTVGLSYSGTTAEFLLVNRHPAVKAAATLFSLYDVYDDIAFPGGVHLSGFTYHWNVLNQDFDRNELPGEKYEWLIEGVKPVDGDRDRSLLRAAVAQHNNYDVYQLARLVRFRDDTAKPVLTATVDTFSPHRYRAEIAAGGAAVYSYSGWYDGAYAAAAIKRFLSMNAAGAQGRVRLMLGPWNHGAGYIVSPKNPGKANFFHFGEVLKFFDRYLRPDKPTATQIDSEPLVHYYTMGEEKWHHAPSWPPPHRLDTLYLSNAWPAQMRRPLTKGFDLPPNKIKALHRSPAPADTLHYTVDTLATTGDNNRWTSLRKPLSSPELYLDRELQDRRLLVLETEPLTEPYTLTGHPVVRIPLAADQREVTLFAYLEVVDAKGKVSLITEGCLRTLHGESARTPAPLTVGQGGPAALPVDVPYVPRRGFWKQDSLLLHPDAFTEVAFDLQPTSYQFQRGERIRLCIGGADRGNYELLNTPPAKLRILCGGAKGARLILPREVSQ
jgi:putative CocE/NonD family hydrolase